MDVIVTMIIVKRMMKGIAAENANYVLRAHRDRKDRQDRRAQWDQEDHKDR